MGKLDSNRCATCGHSPLLLLVLDVGLILRTRFGCLCSSIRLYPEKTENLQNGCATGDVATGDRAAG